MSNTGYFREQIWFRHGSLLWFILRISVTSWVTMVTEPRGYLNTKHLPYFNSIEDVDYWTISRMSDVLIHFNDLLITGGMSRRRSIKMAASNSLDFRNAWMLVRLNHLCSPTVVFEIIKCFPLLCYLWSPLVTRYSSWIFLKCFGTIYLTYFSLLFSGE